MSSQYYEPRDLVVDVETYAKRMKEAVESTIGPLVPQRNVMEHYLGALYRAGYDAALTDVITFRNSLLKPVVGVEGKAND